MAIRHFRTLLDFSPDELRALVARATEMKREWREGVDQRRYAGKVLAMVFEKSSTRTRACVRGSPSSTRAARVPAACTSASMHRCSRP